MIPGTLDLACIIDRPCMKPPLAVTSVRKVATVALQHATPLCLTLVCVIPYVCVLYSVPYVYSLFCCIQVVTVRNAGSNGQQREVTDSPVHNNNLSLVGEELFTIGANGKVPKTSAANAIWFLRSVTASCRCLISSCSVAVSVALAYKQSIAWEAS